MYRRYSATLLLIVLGLAACSSAPPARVKPTVKPHAAPSISKSSPPATPTSTKPITTAVNPYTRLPPQTDPVPQNPSDMPAFGSDAFNRIKDGYPDAPPDVSQVPDAIPQHEPLAKYGNKSPYTVLGKTYKVLPSPDGFQQTGKASFYGKKFHGLRTSSGEPYNMYAMTAAHRNLPLPSYVRVTNVANNKSVIVKVNDRGPFHSERVMDLSYSAAARLDILKAGTGTVRIEAISQDDYSKEIPPSTPGNTAPDAPQFYVQIGAFGVKGNATSLQNRVADMIYSPVNVINSDGIHRVHVGPFFTRDDAEKAAAIIHDNNLGNPIIVQR